MTQPIPEPMQETTPLTPTPDPIPQEAQAQDKDEIIATLREALLTAKAQATCARLGVSEARTAYVLRLANLAAIDDPLTADAAIREAIDAVLSDVPELRGVGTGASGAFRVRRGPVKDAFERGLRGGALPQRPPPPRNPRLTDCQPRVVARNREKG